MACPHVSGVAALGLAYAVKQHRHYRAADFVSLLKKSVKDLDGYYGNGAQKVFYYNHTTVGASPEVVDLSKYVGKMGAGLVDAGKLLQNVDGKEYSSDMKLPNVYVAVGKNTSLDLSAYFNGQADGYTASVENGEVATAIVAGKQLTVTGSKVGSTKLTITAADGTSQTVVITVRQKAGNNGWM